MSVLVIGAHPDDELFGPWIEQKIAGFEAHRTQHGVFLSKNPNQSIADIVDRVESFHRILPVNVE